MIQELEARIKRIEDRTAISELRAHYSFLVDHGRGKEAIGLFTDDGEMRGPGRRWRGYDELLVHFGQPSLDATWHFICNEIIEVDGDSATGKCYCEMPAVLEGESYVCACQYDDVLVRQNGTWKFKSREVTFYYFVPLKEGWGKKRMQFPGLSD